MRMHTFTMVLLAPMPYGQEILLIFFIYALSLASYYVLRNLLLPLRRNRLATMNSLGSLRLPPFLLSPLAHEARGGPEYFARPLNLINADVNFQSRYLLLFPRFNELLSHSDD